ncbi:MAG: hypothetical protein DMG45_01835 [Acidobacteria bacterium]|nr:MAG: hypothetical protein DMG45_01835 [Acidobacteriota bacterium]
MSEFRDLFKAHFVADLRQIRDKLTADLTRAGKTAGLAALVFANARKPFVKSEILPLVNYWNYRSKDHASFFFVGFVGDEEDDSEFSAKINPEDSFVERVFVETIEHFENNTSWKYRGDTPLILCRGYLLYHKQTRKPRAFLDLDSLVRK